MSSKRIFNRRRHMHVLNELNVTPLLDLCFCLLIIFMIATPVLEQTTQIDLPRADKSIASKPVDTPVKTKTIALDRNGQLIYDGHATHEAALRVELKKLAALPKERQPHVHVRADGALSVQRLVDVFSLAQSCGLANVVMDTEVKD
ncbi:MAG: biopolymer transporter ExbD [Puniceicoccales bacterium]|jgi:biopolymer transport protein ExbD|nr:biopolymer transporter ExbD [Puniceicoccales bacterium]